MNITTRWNPTLNGSLPLGHIYSLLVNERFAHENNGVMVLRFDDNSPPVQALSHHRAEAILQNQIYDIISQVNKKLKINFVMTEGDLYGEVPDEKIQTFADQISNRKKLVQQKNNLKNADENSRLSKQLNNSIKKIDREIILKGAFAPHTLPLQAVTTSSLIL